MADTFQPVAPRPAPVRTEGFVPWVKRNLFADWKNGLTTVLLVALALALLPGLVHWGLTQAVFPANAEACRLMARYLLFAFCRAGGCPSECRGLTSGHSIMNSTTCSAVGLAA